MKQIAFLGFLLGFVSLGISLSRAGDPAKSDLDRLQGKWKLVSAVNNGKATNVADHKVWQITGNKIIRESKPNAYIEVDATKKPKALDMNIYPGKKTVFHYKGIYEIEEDTLKICICADSGSGAVRPTTFESKEKSGNVLYVLNRVKDESERDAGPAAEPGVALRPGPHSGFAQHAVVAAAPAGELLRSIR